MVKTTLYLDQDLALELRQLAEAERRPQAELIREALVSYTRRRKRPRPPGIGEFSSGHPDTSVRAEEILAEAARKGRWR
jgi:hypothetical protein